MTNPLSSMKPTQPGPEIMFLLRPVLQPVPVALINIIIVRLLAAHFPQVQSRLRDIICASLLLLPANAPPDKTFDAPNHLS